MSCAWGSAAEIAECIVMAREWTIAIWPIFDAVASLIGVGTFALVSILIWSLSKAKKDIEKTEGTAAELRATSQKLRSTITKAIHDKDEADKRARTAMENQKRLQEQFGQIQAPINEQLDELRTKNEGLENKIELVRTASEGHIGKFWGRPPGARLNNYEQKLSESIPVLLFANQKGGVGKTTLSANLAACFAARGEKVLTIDIDYQGSLTGLMLAQAGERPDEFPSMIDLLLNSESLNELWPNTVIQTADKNLDYVSCWYSFERLERNLEYRWILGETSDDIRYRLSRAVLSKHVQNEYDRVIIDAPPRMTVGFLNGFCASTHLFVPTVVDQVSARAVGAFAQRFSDLVPTLNPILKFSGVVGTMTTVNYITNMARPAANVAERLVRKELNTNDNYFFWDAVMRRSADIPYSTELGIPYLQNPQTHPMFNKIADEVAKRAPLRN